MKHLRKLALSATLVLGGVGIGVAVDSDDAVLNSTETVVCSGDALVTSPADGCTYLVDYECSWNGYCHPSETREVTVYR